MWKMLIFFNFSEISIDSIESDARPGRKAKIHDYSADFRAIGQALSSCEAGSLLVGIPVLFPSTRIKRLRKSFRGPVGDFFRQSLVTISTNALEAYDCELVERLERADDIESLGIFLPNFIERFFFVVISALLGLVAVFFFYLSLVYLFDSTLELKALWYWVLAFELGVSYIGFGFCTDEARLESFHGMLSREILRRHGKGPGFGGTIRIASADVNPIPD